MQLNYALGLVNNHHLRYFIKKEDLLEALALYHGTEKGL